MLAAAAGTQTGEHILEGVDMHHRPDSSQKPLLYTHVLCPYAQRALLTLLCKVAHLSVLLGLAARSSRCCVQKPCLDIWWLLAGR